MKGVVRSIIFHTGGGPASGGLGGLIRVFLQLFLDVS